MNIYQIKARAQELVKENKGLLIRVLTIVMLLTSLGNLLSSTSPVYLLSLIVLIIFLPISHGNVVAALKVVRNAGHTLNDEDGYVGFKRFKELFTTYLSMGLVEFVVLFLVMIVGFFISGAMIFSLVSSVATQGMNGAEDALMSALLMNPSIFLVIIGFVIVIFVVTYVLGLYLFAVPFLLERYHLVNFQAIKESVQFMKGHKLELFKIDMSFLGWLILSSIVAGILSQFTSGIGSFGVGITLVVTGLFEIYTFMPQYLISKAILFEEIAYQRYGQPSQEQDVQEDVEVLQQDDIKDEE